MRITYIPLKNSKIMRSRIVVISTVIVRACQLSFVRVWNMCSGHKQLSRNTEDVNDCMANNLCCQHFVCKHHRAYFILPSIMCECCTTICRHICANLKMGDANAIAKKKRSPLFKSSFVVKLHNRYFTLIVLLLLLLSCSYVSHLLIQPVLLCSVNAPKYTPGEGGVSGGFNSTHSDFTHNSPHRTAFIYKLQLRVLVGSDPGIAPLSYFPLIISSRKTIGQHSQDFWPGVMGHVSKYHSDVASSWSSSFQSMT